MFSIYIFSQKKLKQFGLAILEVYGMLQNFELDRKNFELIKSLYAKVFQVCILRQMSQKNKTRKNFELYQND